MKTCYLALLLLGVSLSAAAQTPTWSVDVAPVIYNRCASCHRAGGIAPFTLLSYSDAIAHASSIRAEIQDGNMPPWPPDPKYKHLAHERVLTALEKQKIFDWLDNGRPRGDVSLEPPAPTFSPYGDLPGTPDLILKIPPYTSNAAMGDVYRCFVLPTGLTADKFVTAFECVPGNRSIVHHVLVYADTTGTSTRLDNLDPGPGYTNFGGIGTDSAILIGGWVPGASPVQYPQGFGMHVSKDARIVMQVHYPVGTAGMSDSTELHLFFSPTNSVRNLMMIAALNHLTNIDRPLVIPANTVQHFTEQQALPVDVTLFGVTPHMHLIGTQIKSYGVTPRGDTLPFISIPEWDFHWQGSYMFQKALKMPAGTVAYAQATFDNTPNNPHNPSNPPQTVRAGEATTDEMMVVFFLGAFYQPGDENIVLDSVGLLDVKTPRNYYGNVDLLQPYPVPAAGNLVVKYYLSQASAGSVSLLDMNGKVLREIQPAQKLNAGYTALPVDVTGLPSGIYTLRLNAAGITKSRVVSIRH
jgi:hypothetical protein